VVPRKPETMSTTQEQAQEVAGRAKEQAGQAAQQARGRVRDQVDQRSTMAGERVTTTAQDVRAVADTLRDQGKDQPAKLAEQAAERAEKLGGYLQDADADTILSDLEDLGRKQPLAVVAGGIALGFVASRFIKASSAKRFESSASSVPSTSAPSYPAGTGYGAAPATTRGTGYSSQPVGYETTGDLPARTEDVAPAFPDPVVPPVTTPATHPAGGL
jgi:hypothetical protein